MNLARTLLGALICIAVLCPDQAAAVETDVVAVDTAVNAPLSLPDRKQLEAQTGRRLKFGERIAYNIYRKKLERGKLDPLEGRDRRTRRQGLWGLSLGVVALLSLALVSFPPLGLLTLLFIPGLILSIIALSRSKTMEDPTRVRGIAIAGIVISSLIPFFWIIGVIIVAVSLV